MNGLADELIRSMQEALHHAQGRGEGFRIHGASVAPTDVKRAHMATGPTKGIDHLVLCTRDLDLARAAYAAMGFTLTPQAAHPFGTGNSLVQLQGAFLELLAVLDPALIPEHGPGKFSFAAFNRDYLEAGEGFSMLVLTSDDARADHARFAAAGLSTYEPFDFERKAKLPSGEEVTVGFSLAFVTHEEMGRAAFFTCQQRAPQHFWKPDYQHHDNGALSLGDVLMLSETPAPHARFFEALAGSAAVEVGEGEFRLPLAHGGIRVLAPEAWARHYPAAFAPDLPEGPCFAGYTVEVGDLARASACLDEGHVAYLRDGERLVIAPDDAFETMIVFVERAR